MTAINHDSTTQGSSQLLPGLVAALAAAAIGLGFANFVGAADGENGSASDFAFMMGLSAVVAAVLFLVVLPRTRTDGPAKVWLGVLSLLAFPAFWSGLPMVFGVAAIAAARRAGSVAWAVVGGLAVVASLAVCVVG